jgi:hypothetical protein
MIFEIIVASLVVVSSGIGGAFIASLRSQVKATLKVLAEIQTTLSAKPKAVVPGQHAICSECGREVARFTLKGENAVCANCDPASFAKEIK